MTNLAIKESDIIVAWLIKKYNCENKYARKSDNKTLTSQGFTFRKKVNWGEKGVVGVSIIEMETGKLANFRFIV